MRVIKIPKRDGTFRTVVAPTGEEKGLLRAYIHSLQVVANIKCPRGVVHGFWPGRSPVTNAMFHVGYQYTACFDLKDFFDTVTREMVTGIIPDYMLNTIKALSGGIATQGLPTSPVIANIAAAKMDHSLEAYCT